MTHDTPTGSAPRRRSTPWLGLHLIDTRRRGRVCFLAIATRTQIRYLISPPEPEYYANDDADLIPTTSTKYGKDST